MNEPLCEMSSGALQDRSERLAALVEQLGAALRSSGVADDAAARVLENASAAVLDALTLEVMLTDARPAQRVSMRSDTAAPEPALPQAA